MWGRTCRDAGGGGRGAKAVGFENVRGSLPFPLALVTHLSPRKRLAAVNVQTARPSVLSPHHRDARAARRRSARATVARRVDGEVVAQPDALASRAGAGLDQSVAEARARVEGGVRRVEAHLKVVVADEMVQPPRRADRAHERRVADGKVARVRRGERRPPRLAQLAVDKILEQVPHAHHPAQRPRLSTRPPQQFEPTEHAVHERVTGAKQVPVVAVCPLRRCRHSRHSACP